MSSKLGNLNTVGTDIRNFSNSNINRQLDNLMVPTETKHEEVGKIAFKEIELERITTRSINN